MASNTQELKSLLHESIENIDDEELLLMAKSLLDRKYKPAEAIELNEYQKQRIEKAKASIARGEYLSNEQADKLVAQWHFELQSFRSRLFVWRALPVSDHSRAGVDRKHGLHSLRPVPARAARKMGLASEKVSQPDFRVHESVHPEECQDFC